HPIDRNEYVAPRIGAVLEHGVQRHVPAPDLDARVIGGNQRAGDAEVLLVAEEVIGIEGPEGESEERCDGAERDVALLPGHAQTKRLPPLVLAAADDAEIRNRCRVGAGMRISEREAW